jgi:sigma-B regulation protein RsbU (phosphoserine phosphatase)
MRESISAWDQAQFMQTLNRYLQQTRQDLEYATVSVLGFYRPEGCLAITNAGHHPAAWYHAAKDQWSWIEEKITNTPGGTYGLPIGLIPGTEYFQTQVTLGRGDLLVLYTDGITDSENSVGEQLGRDQLLDWLRGAPSNEPEALGQALLGQLSRYRDGKPSDDETLIVLQHTG